METKTSDLKTREGLQALVDIAPYHRWLGIEVVSVAPDTGAVTTRLRHKPDFDRLDGAAQFHGGLIATLIDTTGDLATAVVAGGAVPTIALHVDYLRPALGLTLEARASVRRAGRTLAVVDVDVTDAEGRLVAVGRGNYSTRVG